MGTPLIGGFIDEVPLNWSPAETLEAVESALMEMWKYPVNRHAEVNIDQFTPKQIEAIFKHKIAADNEALRVHCQDFLDRTFPYARFKR